MSRRRKRLPECRADKVYWCFLTTSVLLPLPQCAGKPAPWGRGSPRDGDAAGPWQGKVLLESTREDKYCLSAPSTGRQSGARQGGGVLGGKAPASSWNQEQSPHFPAPGRGPRAAPRRRHRRLHGVYYCSWSRSPAVSTDHLCWVRTGATPMAACDPRPHPAQGA